MSERFPQSTHPELAHEIRTALHTLVGVTGLLTATSLDDEQSEYVDAIREGTDRILQLVGEPDSESPGTRGQTEDVLTQNQPAREIGPAAVREALPAVILDRRADSATKADAVAESEKSSPQVSPSAALSRVLVVEDNMINRRVMVRLMERLGYKVDSAVDGIDAIDSVARKTYDLIFMDLQMPRMDGIEAMKNIRKSESDHRPWIIALTAAVSDEDRAACSSAGADDFLAKPVRSDEIQAAIQRALGKSRKDRGPVRRQDPTES